MNADIHAEALAFMTCIGVKELWGLVFGNLNAHFY